MAGLFDTPPSRSPEELEQEKQRLRLRSKLGIQPGELSASTESALPEQLPEESSVQEEIPAPLEEEVEEEQPSGPGATVIPPKPLTDERPKVAKVAMPDPKDFQLRRDKLIKLEKISDSLPENVKQEYTNRIQEYKDREKRAEQLYNERESRLNWAQTAQLLGNALTQLAAGYYGLKTGYNMDGVKFAQVDWEKKLDRIFDQYDRDTNRFVKQKESAEGELERAQLAQKSKAEKRDEAIQRQDERAADKEADLKLKLAEEKRRAQEFNAKAENDANLLDTKLRNMLARTEQKQAGKPDKQNEKSVAEAQKYNNTIQEAMTLNKEIASGQTASGESLSSKDIKKKEEQLRQISTKVLGIPAEQYEKDRAAKKGGFLGFMQSPDAAPFEGTLKSRQKTVRMVGPDGSVAEVPPEKVEMFKRKGAKVMQ